MKPYMNFNKNNKKRKIKIISLIMIFILVIGIGVVLLVKNKKEIVVKNLDKGTFINVADEISEPFKQIRWDEIAAIIATKNKGNLSSVTENDIKEIGNKFIENEDGNLTLVGMQDVMNELGFKDKEKNQTEKFLIQISSMSIKNGEIHKEFINDIKEGAIETYKKYKILPSITIAQAILETGWGKSDLTTKANNYFGIKADNNWSGKKITMETKEYNDKVIKDNFRQYDNRIDSFKDHGEFLSKNQRYKEAGLFTSGHYTEQANALQSAGYSTVEDELGNKIYAKLLIDIIKDNNLMNIDNEAEIEN